jgi:hypothetical protein
MPPQEGKSTRVAKDFVLWVLKQRPWTRCVGASYGQGLANRNGRSIRNVIRSNPDLGLRWHPTTAPPRSGSSPATTAASSPSASAPV